MGCVGSKLDDLQTVALCRARCRCLEEAIRLRYALAEAHAGYLLALRAVGDSLRYLNGGTGVHHSLPSPVLPLPTQRKGDNVPPLSPPPSSLRAAAAASVAAPAAPVHHISRSNSGNHLQFHDSDSEVDDDDGSLHSEHSSPLHHLPRETDHMGVGPTTFMHYAKKGAAAPVGSYEQPAATAEVIQIGESSSYYGYSYPRQEAGFYSHPYSYAPPYAAYGGMSSFFGASSPPPALSMPPSSVSPSTTKLSPPPPSPPSVPTWDFLNPFETFDNYYPSYTPSRSSNVVREEEGIPDLEDEEGEVIKEAYGDPKSVATSSSAVNFDTYASSKAVADEDRRRSTGEQQLFKAGTSGGGGNGGERDFESKMAEKNVATDEVQKRQPEDAMKRKTAPSQRVASEVVQEITVLFHKASESGDMVSRMLEVGKLPYQRKHYHVVSSKMRNVGLPPISRNGVPSTSMDNEGYPVFDEEKAMESGNLSSTLQRLYMWEKKLYEEVKIEEKMRMLYERKSKLLKYLDERGAETDKIASTQALIKKLANKIRVAIQVIDTISNRISSIKDEELWPEINELIHGFSKMWRATLECHSNQCQAVAETESLDAVISGVYLSDVHMEALKQLELSLLRWIETFCSWSNAHRGFVKALNGWFLTCTAIIEPEVTSDGVVPFSPGRLGAPTVFIVCNQWSQAMDGTSDREVISAMQAFAGSILHLWDQQKMAVRQQMMANKDMDKQMKAHEREQQVIHRAVNSLNKKLISVSESNGIPLYGQMMHQINSYKSNSLHESLQRVFDAMERFADASLKIHEDLIVRAAEERVHVS